MVFTTSDLYKKLELKNKEIVLLTSLENYYKDNINFDLLVDIINGDDKISKRTIEYFVTQYSGKNNIVYTLNNGPNKDQQFNVYNSYKNQLKAYKKKYFDPFGRGDRIPFFINDDCIITTVGQLNFYKWFFSKEIYDYCFNNYNTIQTSLLNIKKTSTRKPKTVKVVKPQYSYQSNINNNGRITVSFSL